MEGKRWTSIAGKIVSTAPDGFILDSGSRLLTVEMDDWDPTYREGVMLRAGDHVAVTGAVDQNGPAETRRIEADSVFVTRLNTYFYANPLDEERLRRPRPNGG